MENKVQQLIEKEASNVEVQVEEKGINTNPMNIITQEEGKPVEEKTYLNVAFQMINIPSEGSITNSTTSSPEVNQNTATHMIGERQTKRILYLHPNHRNRHLNQFTNLYHSEHKQQTYAPKTTKYNSVL